MGISGLTKFLRSKTPGAFKPKHMDEYKDEVLAYDTLNSLYKFGIALSARGVNNPHLKVHNPHLKMITDICTSCFLYNIVPVHIFDGRAPRLKRKIIEMRASQSKSAKDDLKKATSEEDILKFTKKSFTILPHMIPDCKKLLEYIGLPYIQSPEEADSQCAAMVTTENGVIKYVVTDDLGDSLAFGTPFVLRNFSKKGLVEEVSLNKILTTLNISHSQFVDLCILSSTDYCITIKGVGTSTGYETIREVSKNKNLYQVNAQSSIPGFDTLLKLLESTDYRTKLWPHEIHTTDTVLSHDQLNEYLNKLINDDRFGIMFKVVFKLHMETNKKDSKKKYIIPSTFLCEYIDTKLYYTETFNAEDPVKIQRSWHDKVTTSTATTATTATTVEQIPINQIEMNTVKKNMWNAPQYDKISAFLCEKGYSQYNIENDINFLRRFYNNKNGRDVVINGKKHMNVSFSSEPRYKKRSDGKWRDKSPVHNTTTLQIPIIPTSVDAPVSTPAHAPAPAPVTVPISVRVPILANTNPSIIPSAYSSTHKRVCRIKSNKETNVSRESQTQLSHHQLHPAQLLLKPSQLLFKQTRLVKVNS